MSVISRNPFDLLGDDGSEPVVTSQPKATTQAKPAAAAAAAPREVPGSKPPRGRGGDATAARGARGGQYYARGGPRNVIKTEGQAAEVIAVEPETGFEGERRAPSRGQGAPRGEGRGRGRATRARGGRGGAAGGEGRKDGAYTGGERRHDGRKSAHALPDTEKRVASGWGAEEGTAELVAEVEGANDASEESATPQTPAAEGSAEEVKPAAEEAVTGQHKTEEEEEDNTKSYEEYLAERAQAALNLNIGKLEGRKVEGTSEIVGAALQKPEEEEWYQGANKDKTKATEKAKATKKEKVFIEFEARFPPPAGTERRGGRGGAARGGDRGRGAPRNTGDRPARGGPRGGRGGARAAPAVAVNDESAFPALGA